MAWQRIPILVLPLALSMLIACDDSSPTSPAISLPATVQLQVGQSVLVSSGDLVVGFTEVMQDSRCPSNSTTICAWEGEAVVKVEVSANRQALGSPLLSTHPNNGSSPNAVSLEGYRLQALELDPYPVTWNSIPPSDYRLTLRIEDG